MFNKKIILKDNLINNIKQVKQCNQHSLICAMVKANAYGVGTSIVVDAVDEYVDYYGVACFFEAKRLRQYTKKKILIVGPLDEDIDPSFSYTCSSLDDVKELVKKDIILNIHLKVNSGMNRYGFSKISEFREALRVIVHSKLNLEGVYTHFATTDEFVDEQMKKFNRFVTTCYKYKLYPLIHADNSGVNISKNHRLDMVRIGFNLYNRNDNRFFPAVMIMSKVIGINNVKKGALVGYDRRCVAKRRMRVAVIPLGYADGFDMRYIGLNLNVRGVECGVLNVCMDCFMLDVSGVDIKKGDDIYILDHINSLRKYAIHSGISEYQVMTNFSHVRADELVTTSQCEYE